MVFPELLQFYDLGLWLLRFAVGIVFIVHSFSKLKNPGGMAQGMGYPKAFVIFLGLGELLGGISLIFGIYIQLGALYYHIFKWKDKFAPSGKFGWEFPFLLLASALSILLTGGGTMLQLLCRTFSYFL